MKFCEECGSQLDDNAVFCENCGAKIEDVEEDYDSLEAAGNNVQEEAKAPVPEETEIESQQVNVPKPDPEPVAVKEPEPEYRVEKEPVIKDPETNSTVIQEQKKSKTGFVIIAVLVAVIVLLVAGSAVLFATGVVKFSGNESDELMENEQKPDKQSGQQTVETQVATPSVAPTAEPTAEPTAVPTAVPTATPKPTKKPDNSYVIKGSDKKYLDYDDIKKLSKAKLRLARNEIYARHGYKFKDKELRKFFKKKAWYKPTLNSGEWSDAVLNEYEKANLELISDVENGVTPGKTIEQYGGRYILNDDYMLTINQYSSEEGNEVGNFCLEGIRGGDEYSGPIFKTGNNELEGLDYGYKTSVYITLKEDSVGVQVESAYEEYGQNDHLEGEYQLVERYVS